MFAILRHLVMVTGILLISAGAAAQSPRSDAVLFIWNDELFAQGLNSSELIATGHYANALPSMPPLVHGGVFSYRDSGLAVPPPDGYGFYRGVRSADSARLAYLVIQEDSAGYQVVLAEGDDAARVLFSGTVSPQRGYLVPVGWANDGALMLLERYMLHNLQQIRLWAYADGDTDATLRHTGGTLNLRGSSATLGGGWVFVGFDTVGMLAYLVNINTGQVISTVTSLALQPPPSVFETYPFEVVGVADLTEVRAWLAANPPIADPALPAQPAWETPPFLHWPLPDSARSITCYPDSAWTDLNYAVECPGLASPRAYQGHEGTDIGGKPVGLPTGTSVYAAARGVVVAQNTGCAAGDVSCGDAYGNYILIEHSRVINHEIETWFTGYAHLQAVFAAQHRYIAEIGLPIAASGDTGLGGAHLHFEVRSPQQPARTAWIDPWDVRQSADGATSLWVGGHANPVAAVVAAPPPALLICRTVDGNNIRGGPGTEFAVVAKSAAALSYDVIQIQTVQAGGTPGDWYHLRLDDSGATGWIYAELMDTCDRR